LGLLRNELKQAATLSFRLHLSLVSRQFLMGGTAAPYSWFELVSVGQEGESYPSLLRSDTRSLRSHLSFGFPVSSG